MAAPRTAVFALVAAVLCGGCAGRRLAASPATPLALTCDYASSELAWVRATDPGERSRLDLWCASVGPPVVVHAPEVPADVRRLVVVSWNVYVGGARVRELIDVIRRLTPQPEGGQVGIVLLLQEMFRAGASVPATVPPRLDAPDAIRPRRPAPDVVALAHDTGFSLAYVPSMRNGRDSAVYEREDRGTAILSSEPLSHVTAIELPFGRQRRVAVMATVDPRGDAPPLRMITAHFDILRGTGQQAEALAAFVDAQDDGPPFVMGVDTNAALGVRSGPVSTIDAIVPRLTQCGDRRTTRWFARPDFLFTTLPERRISRCDTLRERYGSDHAPLVAWIDY
jgi:endonuclease/exonuclease/phosphatase family metal-dependent hydrolase